MIEALRRDFGFAVRALMRSPGFTLVAGVTLGIGIGANTAIFSVVDGVLLRGLPYDEPDALVSVWLDMSRKEGPAREWLSYPDFEDFRDEAGLFEAVGVWEVWGPTLTGRGDPAVLAGARVSEGLFERVLRTQPSLGRGFMADEMEPGAPGVALISHGLWLDRFAADPGVLGRPLTLDDEPYTVVGVMPEGFEPPFVRTAQVWSPVRYDAAGGCTRGCNTLRATARLAPGVTLEQARTRALALVRRLGESYPVTHAGVDATLRPLRDELVGSAGRGLWMLFGAVGFVLLIACSNVANLLLVRGAAREGELAVRIALGAQAGPIVRQLLAESLVLAGLGGLLGVGIAAWGTEALLALAPPLSVPGASSLGVDARVLGFTVLLSLSTGLVFGLVPAVRSARADVYAALRSAERGRSGGRLRGAFVVLQVSLAVVLLVGAGLLIRSLERLGDVPMGFNPDGVLAVSTALPGGRYRTAAERVRYYRVLVDRVRTLPGVLAASATSSVPLAGNDVDADLHVEGAPAPEPGERRSAWVRRVGPGYFYTAGVQHVAGRDFEAGDDVQRNRVAIVNETLARRQLGFPRRDPLGARLRLKGETSGAWHTVVGVVRDTRHFGVREGARPAVYLPYAQSPTPAMTLMIRTDGDPLELAADARAAVSAIDPSLAASQVVRLSTLVDRALATERFLAAVLGLFATLAVVLAAVGLYGVISYGVTQRMREMGIRLALGAVGADVRRMVVRGGLALAAVGLIAGALGASVLAGVLEALLYDVSASDPLTFAVTTGALGAVAVLASWAPAARAARADPVEVLREQ